MATPLVMDPNPPPRKDLQPGSVLGAKLVQLAIVKYVDDMGQEVTQFAVVGDNNVTLLDSKISGLSRTTSPVGTAKSWLKDGILKLLKKGKKSDNTK